MPNAENELSIKLSVSGMENDIFIENENGTTWKSIKDIKDEEQAKIGINETHNFEVGIPMDIPRYIKTGNPSFPRIKIKEVKVLISNREMESTTEIDGTKMVGFVLKNLIDNSEVVLDKNAKIRKCV